MSTLYTAIGTFLVLTFLLFLRLLSITPTINPRSPARKHPYTNQPHLLIVLGSGGHTAEALRLLSTIDIFRFTHRTYIVSSGDSFSARKAVEFEESQYLKRSDIETAKGGKDCDDQLWDKGSFEVKEIPRARKVGQSWMSTPWSSLRCLMGCFSAVRDGKKQRRVPDLVVCNGPGSAVMVVAACFVYKFLGIGDTRTIYVESFARVTSISLSGKLLYPFVDRFIVQWPGQVEKFPRAEYHGTLV